MNIVVSANPATSDRAGSISINNAALTISEAAAPPPQPPAPAPPAPNPNPSPNPAPPPPTAQPTPISFRATVQNLAGACPFLTFRANGRQVVTDSQTQFTKGTCADVRNGGDVVVDGQLLASGIVRATTVQLKK